MTNVEKDAQGHARSESVRPALIGAAMFVAVLVALGCGIFWFLEAPPLHVFRAADAVTMNIETLGEYPTTVSHLRVTEADSGTLIWEIRSSGIAQARAFKLHVGENPALVKAEYGSFETLTPPSRTFVLHGGVRYKIELWGSIQSRFLKRTAVFRLDSLK